jgi:hypothetical protein
MRRLAVNAAISLRTRRFPGARAPNVDTLPPSPLAGEGLGVRGSGCRTGV